MASDPLSDLSMKPTRDDLATRQQKDQKRRQRSHPVELDQKTQNPNRNNALLSLILMVGLGAGAGGWFIWNEMSQLRVDLKQSKDLLSESQNRLGDLKQNIDSQSADLNETGSAVQADMKLQMSEIRKLWDLSNKHNKPAIAFNKAAISSLKGSLEKQKKLLAAVEATSAASKKTMGSLEAQVKQGQLQSTVINNQLDELNDQLKELAAQAKALNNMLGSQEAAIKALQKTGGATLTAKLNDITQRLDSIDAHRRQVNARLDQYDRNISELYKKP